MPGESAWRHNGRQTERSPNGLKTNSLLGCTDEQHPAPGPSVRRRRLGRGGRRPRGARPGQHGGLAARPRPGSRPATRRIRPRGVGALRRARRRPPAAAFLREIADDPVAADRSVARVRRARELAYRVLAPMARGEAPDPTDVEALHRWLLGVLRSRERRPPMPLDWSTGLGSVHDVADEVGLHVWRLLEREDADAPASVP